MTPGLRNHHRLLAMVSAMSFPHRVNLIEDAAIAEETRLHLLPAAEIVHGNQRQFGESREIFGIGQLGVEGPIEVLCRKALTISAVEIFKIGPCHLGGSFSLCVGIDKRDRRLGLDRDRRHDDLELVATELLQRKKGLVFPREKNVTDAALYECRCRSTRTRVENRNVVEES